MYTCIYIHIHIYIHIYTHTHIHIYIYTWSVGAGRALPPLALPLSLAGTPTGPSVDTSSSASYNCSLSCAAWWKFLKSQLASESTMQKDNRVDFSEFPPGALVLRTIFQKAARYWIDNIESRQSWMLRILIRHSCLVRNDTIARKTALGSFSTVHWVPRWLLRNFTCASHCCISGEVVAARVASAFVASEEKIVSASAYPKA